MGRVRSVVVAARAAMSELKKISTDSAVRDFDLREHRAMEDTNDSLAFVTLSMFIIDEFSFLDELGRPTGRSFPPQES